MKSLDELRQSIDQIDKELEALLKKRLSASKQVSEYKVAHDLPIFHKAREADILARFSSAFPDEQAPFAAAFLKNVIRQSREYQYYLTRKSIAAPTSALKPSVVCYPGIPGSHSGIAAYALYPESESLACESFAAVFSKICEDSSAVGVLPIDNSTAGTVGDVYDLLMHHNLSIIRASTRAISHCLLGIPGATNSGVTCAYSHPQALAQCAGYLKARSIYVRESSNTAVAAKYVAGLSNPAVAAIASRETAALYGLTVLDAPISDEESNQTRFICISQKQTCEADANRISLAFNLLNESGALSDILAVFSDSGINLTKILSRPIPNRPWEYTFYLDCEFDLKNAYLDGVLTHLGAELPSMKLLGIYHEEELS